MKKSKELLTGNVHAGDYVVVRTSEAGKPLRTAPVLVRGQDASDMLYGRIEKDPHIRAQQATFKPEDIIVNLGPNPHPGRVYGSDLTSRYRRTVEHSAFGDVHFFTKPTGDTMAAFWGSLDSVYKILQKNNLEGLLSLPLCFEVIPQERAGRYTGYFVPSRDPEKNPHRVQIAVGDGVMTNASIPAWEYIMLHELGHVAHLTQLIKNDQANAAWISYYTETVQCETVLAEDLKRLMKDFISAETSLSNFASNLEEDDQAALRRALSWVKKTRGISASDINVLVRSNRAEELTDLWPRTVTGPKLVPAVSQYACKNFKELFAETFAFHLLDSKLPKKAEKMMEKSLRLVRIYLEGADAESVN